MKWRTTLVLVVIIALIIYVGLNFRPIPPGGKATTTPDSGMAATGPEVESAGSIRWLKGLISAEVTSIVIALPSSAQQTELTLRDGVWRLAGDSSPLVDETKVAALLTDLFNPSVSIQSDSSPEQLRDGPSIRLGNADNTAEIVVCISSPSDYSHTLVKAADADEEAIWRIDADILGDIGIWGANTQRGSQSCFWLKKNVFTFDSTKLANIDFESPDQNICLAVDEEGKWHSAGTWPLAQFAAIDADALQQWIADLAALRIADAFGQESYFELNFDNPTHKIRLGLDAGEIVSLAGLQADDGKYYVELSSQPGQIYALPEWRFNLYFRRIAQVFPVQHPSFIPEQANFIDFSRDGLNIILIRRGNEWIANDFPHPLRDGAVNHWLDALAYWHPLDSFNPQNAPAIPFGAPTVEISLDGDSKRFRLGESDAAHTVSYVEVAPLNVFSTASADAEIMFPYLEDVFDFSITTPGMETLAQQVAAIIEQNSASFSITSGSPIDDNDDPEPDPVAQSPEQEPEQIQPLTEQDPVEQPTAEEMDTETESPEAADELDEFEDTIVSEDPEDPEETEETKEDNDLVEIFEEPVPTDEETVGDTLVEDSDSVAVGVAPEESTETPDLPAEEEILAEEPEAESTVDEPVSPQNDEPDF